MTRSAETAPAPLLGRSAYGWVIVGITFLSLGLVLGSRFSLGIFLPYLPEALDASPAATSAAFAIAMIGAAALQPLNGLLLDRWGGRVVLSLGLLFGGLAMVGTSFATSLWQLTLFMGLASSVAFAAVSPVSATSIVSSWFERNRGAALGVATSGTKVAMVILPPLLALLIATGGWRMTMLMLGVLIWMMIPAVLLLMKPAPGSAAALRASRRKAGSSGQTAAEPEKIAGMTFRETLRHPTFWIVAFALFANGLIMNLVFIHLPTFVVEQGYSEAFAAACLAALAAIGIVGTMATGALSDRMGRRNVLLLMFAARGLTALAVILMPGPFSMLAFVAVFGLLGYGAIAVIGAFASELFGRRAIGAILGTAYVANQVGGALGTYAGGASLELTGDYGASLWLAVATTLVSFAGILFIRDAAAKAR